MSILFLISMDRYYSALYFIVGPLVFLVSLCFMSLFLPLILGIYNKFGCFNAFLCAFFLGIFLIFGFLYSILGTVPAFNRISIFYGVAGGGAATLSLIVNLLFKKWFVHKRQS